MEEEKLGVDGVLAVVTGKIGPQLNVSQSGPNL